MWFHVTAGVKRLPYKKTTNNPRRNDAETVVSTLFQRGIHKVCLQG